LFAILHSGPESSVKGYQYCGAGRTIPRHSGGSRNPAGEMMSRQPAVYILASKRNGTLYVGVTSNLVKRVWEHKNDAVEGFTKRYGLHLLVWYEMHETMESAIKREKTLKGWRRTWKLELIEASNTGWEDLYDSIL
jgi:putative endonuclease